MIDGSVGSALLNHASLLLLRQASEPTSQVRPAHVSTSPLFEISSWPALISCVESSSVGSTIVQVVCNVAALEQPLPFPQSVSLAET